jgi:hypothetical protein
MRDRAPPPNYGDRETARDEATNVSRSVRRYAPPQVVVAASLVKLRTPKSARFAVLM